MFKATDILNSTSPEFTAELGPSKTDIRAVFAVENLQLIDADYDVNISSEGIVQFVTNQPVPLVYWAVTEVVE